MRIAALAVSILCTSAACAADIAPAPLARVYDWTGLYVGANGGWGSGGGSMTVAGLTSSADRLTGATAGGQVGYNWQVASMVAGLEADYQWAGQSRTFTTGIFNERTSIDSFGTVRGRLGAVLGERVLVYGTGGGAWLTGRDRLTATIGGVQAEILSMSLSGFGWTAGGGVEAALGDRWSVKGEYLYLQSSKVTGSAPIPLALGGGTLNATATVHDHIARVGLNYRLAP